MFSIASYNCRGLPKTKNGLYLRPDINNLFKNNDIICLQETWLCKQDLASLNSIVPGFHGVGETTTDLADNIVRGHAPGGVAILWKDTLEQCVKPVELGLNWCNAIDVTVGLKRFILINVYMPYQCRENEDKYIEVLGALGALIEELDCTCYTIVGDWNANIGDKPNSLFADYMTDFCKDQNLSISSEILLPNDSYTCISAAWGTSSWLDHVVSSSDFHNNIECMMINYDDSDEDHIPVCMTLKIENIPESTGQRCNLSPKVNWDKLSDEGCKEYARITEELLTNIIVPESLNCKNVNCCSDVHVGDLKKYYDDIVACLKRAEIQVFKHAKSSKSRFVNKPGWSEYVADIYSASKDAFSAWRNAGKPTQGPIHHRYKGTRARCKYAVRFVKKNENSLRRESLARKLSELDINAFWREIKNMNNNNVPLPNSIDDAVGEHDIAVQWRNHYMSIFNCIEGLSNDNRPYDLNFTYDDVFVSPAEVESAIKKLADNKSCGADGIYAEHLKYATKSVLGALCRCMTSMFIHGALPESMISVVLVPVIKDKTGKINAKDNYRPIALASVVSKVLENILLSRLSDYLLTHSNQFGLKKKHGTDQCIYVMKELFDAHRSLNGSMFVCFLDASKAFDRVNHNVLFDKLVKRGAPGYIIRLLAYWYSNQRINVRWGSTHSEGFTVTNGVRQGGILSPLLFNIYVDGLSDKLNLSNVGIKYNGVIINHLMYADDLVLFVPSSAGLCKLLRICEQIGISHDIRYNSKKSAIMIIRSKLLKDSVLPEFTLCNETLKVVHVTKYLGHFLSDDLSDDADISRQIRKVYIQANILLRKFHMCSLDVKMTLFRTYCSPMYTAQLWWSHKKSSINKLYTVYHNSFKLLAGVSKYESTSLMCTIFNVQCCQAVLRNLVYKFMVRLDMSNNSVIRAIASSSIRYTSRLRRHWNDQLYV